MPKSNLIVVSNRLPISVSKTADGLEFHDSAGGLATAMSSLDTGGEQIWIGWPGIASEELTPADKRQITRYLRERGCVPVYLDQSEIKGFYQGYANDTLWPLFHYFTSYTRYSEQFYHTYEAVNRRFLQAVRRHLDSNSTVWVHDYHLMLLPELIRHAQPAATIGFFLHIPFPSFEIFRALPERQMILRGLLGADLIGFHIYDYARHFLSSCLRLLGLNSRSGTLRYGGRQIAVDAFPIGIDYDKFTACVKTSAVREAAVALREQYRDQRIILSVDRLDYSKGIPERLTAFDEFLQRYPRWHRHVALVMVAVPSRTEVETYKALREQIEQTVSRINGRYGTIDWTPISYQFRNLEFDQVAALYSEADVALVTPLRDGMNLVAKEYVASKQHRPGVLILSEMAGAIDELPESLAVNPHDIPSLVAAIRRALTMPRAEQTKRLRSMQRRLRSYSVQRWGADFLEQLQAIKSRQDTGSAKLLTPDQATAISHDFTRAKRRLILLDYDGTLKPFVASHRLSDARPSPELLRLLNRLASLPHTDVCIVSGRDKTTLEKWFGRTELGLVAEHGAHIKSRGRWLSTNESFDDAKRRLLPLMHQYVDRTAGAILEEKDYSLVWHYRDVPTELAYTRTANLKHDLQALTTDSNLGVFDGNKVVEVKLSQITKGAAANQLLATNPADFILAIGDDFTDEDMFTSLPPSTVTINVGDDETAARYQLPSVDSVLALLHRLIR